MRNFIQPGTMIALPAPGSVKSGDVVSIGSLIGVAAFAASSGADVEVRVNGVFDLPKITGTAISAGDPCYWDGTGLGTASGTAVVRCGTAVKAAGSSDAIARILLP